MVDLKRHLRYINKLKDPEVILDQIACYEEMMSKNEAVYLHPLKTLLNFLRKILMQIKEYRQGFILYQEACARYYQLLGRASGDSNDLAAKLTTRVLSDFNGKDPDTTKLEEATVGNQ